MSQLRTWIIVWLISSAQSVAADDGVPDGLGELLRHAAEHAPEVRIARREIGLARGARAEADQALTENPSLTVAGGPRISAGEVGVDFAASLEQSFEIAGEGGYRETVADRQHAALLAALEKVRWDVHIAVHHGFHVALLARAERDLAGQILAFQERLLAIAEQRVGSGDAAAMDQELARVEVGRARHAALRAEQAFMDERVRLAETVGLESGRLPDTTGSLDPPRDPPPLRWLIATARQRHPAGRVGRARLSELAARAELAAIEAWPEPSIGVSFTRESGLLEEDTSIVLATLSVPLPLFARNQGARAQADAELAVAREAVDVLEATLRLRIERASRGVAATAAQVRIHGTDILPRAARSLAQLERAFASGQIGILDVSVAREQFLSAQQEAIAAHREYFEHVAALEAALGADPWPDHLHEPRGDR